MRSLLVSIAKALGDAYSGAYGKKRIKFILTVKLVTFVIALVALILFVIRVVPQPFVWGLLIANAFLILYSNKLKLDSLGNPFLEWAEKHKVIKHTPEEVRQALNKLAQPSLTLEATGKVAPLGETKLGGLPDLPKNLDWPLYKGKPLAFLAQVRLSPLASFPLAANLPDSGMLYFFYDQEQAVWGYDPKDQGYFAVLFHPSEKNLAPRKAPAGLKKDAQYKEVAFAPQEAPSYPGWSDPQYGGLDDELKDRCQDLAEKSLGDGPCHRILGYPDQIQGDMKLECQLVSNGINCGGPDGYKDPRVKELEKGAKDWRLLFQVDSDDRTNMMWGDGGRLYFWVTEKMIKERRFGDGRMILQCY
jgi:uncharacterized protein YwqG